MNYFKVYCSLIRKAQRENEGLKRDYEKRHVFPISVFGENKYLVKLTYRQHFIAHLLLMKAFQRRYGRHHPKTAKMNMAFHRMVYTTKRKYQKCTSYIFELARKACVEAKKGKRNETLRLIHQNKRRYKEMGLPYPQKIKKRGYFQKSFDEWRDVLKKRNTCETTDFYSSMSDEEFDAWMSERELFNYSKKDGRRRVNQNVIRALTTRGVPLKKYYQEEDFGKNYLSLRINQIKFYGL